MNCAPISASRATRPILSQSFKEKGRSRPLACSMAGLMASVAERSLIWFPMRVP